jgi:SAM-dependent methyltransferase
VPSPNAAPSGLTEHLGQQTVHEKAKILSVEPLTVSTSPPQWSYALSYKLNPELLSDHALTVNLRCVFDVSVATGQIGIGWTNPEDTAFVDERFVAGARRRVAFTLRSGTRVGRLMFRNAASGGTPSVFSIHEVQSAPIESQGRSYPVAVASRNLAQESVPEDGGTRIVFDTDAARALNAARINWLERANLPIASQRVFDVGCGIGHFIPFYLSHGCTVVAVDGRAENIDELRRRHPGIEAHVADAQELDARRFGAFDIVHCFGLLYHLDSPVAALRRLGGMCTRLLILETMVCDSAEPLAVLVDETKAASQAMDGLGSRPSPAFIALALNRAGFDYVYAAAEAPLHPDFQFDWKNNRETTRDGVPLRCVLVASKVPLDLRTLTPLVEP